MQISTDLLVILLKRNDFSFATDESTLSLIDNTTNESVSVTREEVEQELNKSSNLYRQYKPHTTINIEIENELVKQAAITERNVAKLLIGKLIANRGIRMLAFKSPRAKEILETYVKEITYK